MEVRVARIFNTFGPRMHMNDGNDIVHHSISVGYQSMRLLAKGDFVFLFWLVKVTAVDPTKGKKVRFSVFIAIILFYI